MKTIIQLLIVALLINGTVRAVESAWRYYSLKDAIEQEVLFGANRTKAQLHQRIVEMGGDYGVDMDPADVVVGGERGETTVTFSYYEGIPLVPRAYTRQHLFEGSVSIRSLQGLK